jgi:hypothetical protein
MSSRLDQPTDPITVKMEETEVDLSSSQRESSNQYNSIKLEPISPKIEDGALKVEENDGSVKAEEMEVRVLGALVKRSLRLLHRERLDEIGLRYDIEYQQALKDCETEAQQPCASRSTRSQTKSRSATVSKRMKIKLARIKYERKRAINAEKQRYAQELR